MNAFAQSVLDFWFGSEELTPETAGARMKQWFSSNADFDYDIERRFGKLVSLSSKGGFDNWQEDARSNLALVILLDQFPRNLYRGTAKAFATDAKALELCKYGLARGDLKTLSPIESIFLLMPFQHAENLDDQNQGIDAYQTLSGLVPTEWNAQVNGVTDFAQRHRSVIEKFGRFPHRNEMLGRATTTEEQTYLDTGGETF